MRSTRGSSSSGSDSNERETSTHGGLGMKTAAILAFAGALAALFVLGVGTGWAGHRPNHQVLAQYSSGITEAVANVNERYKMPFLAYGASSTPIWEKGRRYIFNIVAVAEDYQKGAVHLARQIGVTKAAIIGQDSLFPRQAGKGAKHWCKKLGIDVVLEENYPTKQTDFTAL